MTIDKAISHEREVAKENREIANKIKEEDALYCDRNATDDIENMDYIKENDRALENCERCAKEHEQLAEWLGELKLLRKKKSEFKIIARDNYEIGYNKAIDDFVGQFDIVIDEKCGTDTNNYFRIIVKEVAEQLKAGGENGKLSV